MGFPRLECWSGLPFPSPEDLPTQWWNPHLLIGKWILYPWASSKSESTSHSVISNSLQIHRLYNLWNSPSQNTGVGSLSLLQGMLPTHGWNPGLPHCRQILYQVSHKGTPRFFIRWATRVTYPFSSRSLDPGIQPGSPSLQADSLPTELLGKTWASREAPKTQLLLSHFSHVQLCVTS